MSFEFNQKPFSVLEDFRRARRRGALQEIVSQLRGKSSDLLSYEEVVQKLKGTEVSASELKDIPINSIVGSVGRYKDFNRRFLPRNSIRSERWSRVKMAMTGLKGVPPIEVYQIGEVYFVKDGNHRVSVAREMGFSHFQAYVTHVRTKVPLTLYVEPDELILKAEFADFLDKTELDQLRPSADLTVSVPGQHVVLLEHIEVHRYYMGIDQDKEISYREAVLHWYETLYQPVVEIIRKRRLLREFYGRTETDLYLFITQHQAELKETLGWDITADTAAAHIEPRASGYQATSEPVREGAIKHETSTPEGLLAKSVMFGDILVAIDGFDGGWNSLQHAALVAQKENGARLHGLHVVGNESELQEPQKAKLQEEFTDHCQTMNLSGRLAIDTGKRIKIICQRARYTDLTVVCLKCSSKKTKMGGGLRTLIRSCPRPLLVVSQFTSPLDSVLLAFDGSDSAREALYTGAYLATQWRVKLVVLTISDDIAAAVRFQQPARDYLQANAIEAIYIRKKESDIVNAILSTAEEQQSNLIVMGAYGKNAPWYINVGSAVTPVLQKSKLPVLIC